jgi:hypothetical protein
MRREPCAKDEDEIQRWLKVGILIVKAWQFEG